MIVMQVYFASQVRQAGEGQAAEMWSFHLGLLQACQSDGIDAAFAKLEEAARQAASAAFSSSASCFSSGEWCRVDHRDSDFVAAAGNSPCQR